MCNAIVSKQHAPLISLSSFKPDLSDFLDDPANKCIADDTIPAKRSTDDPLAYTAHRYNADV